ncbi:MAG: DUF4266 domain-containing protein [Gammaproteobacteria bacterium]|nr:DUF4266 domain-containing protein [Gammaproteobacteria bacterium]
MFRLLVTASVVCILLAGCSVEPWLKPYERANLADPIMNPDRDWISVSHRRHVYEVRQASRGGDSISGGGCGCN